MHVTVLLISHGAIRIAQNVKFQSMIHLPIDFALKAIQLI
jgi:hypothetical protein